MGASIDSAATNGGLNAPRTSIWWSNGLFFVATHIAAALGVWYYPPARAMPQSLWLAVFLWQAASMG